MKKTISILYLVSLVLCLVLLSLSCGGGGSGGGGGSSSLPPSSGGYISGNWSGPWASSLYGTKGTVTANLNQSGSQISGTAFVTRPGLPGGDVSGNVNGSISNPSGPGDITLGIAYSNQGYATFKGSYTNTQISGNYNNLTENDYGTFTLTNQNPTQPQPPSCARTYRCGSTGFAYKECKPGGSSLNSVSIQTQQSNASCTQGTSWGFTSTTIWVNNGCDATFCIN